MTLLATLRRVHARSLLHQRRENDDLRRAYRSLLNSYHDAKQKLAEPCPMCEELERERNNALLELDNAKSDLDDLQATLCWLEGSFFNGKPQPEPGFPRPSDTA